MQSLGVLLVAGAGIFIVWHENGNQKVLMEWLLFLLRERERTWDDENASWPDSSCKIGLKYPVL
jgi:hypothetical protein